LLPLDCEAGPNPAGAVSQTHRASRVYDCCAAEREQAPSPQGICYRLRVRDTPQNLWERACSRWRPTSQHQCWLIHRYREQARSHSVLCIACFHLLEKNCSKFSRHTAPVGSMTAAQPSGSKLPRHKGLVTASESGIHRRTCGRFYGAGLAPKCLLVSIRSGSSTERIPLGQAYGPALPMPRLC